MKQTIYICVTAWAIATEYLIVDLVKFNARTEVVEQAARALRDYSRPPVPPATMDHL
ncbi:MAG TPA: hypothetical protein VFA58_01760 [Chthoniobacterales bacterium]|nr:hypothetical protein [Chthoniobacterales bacterium]